MSYNDENFRRAQLNRAATDQKFFFRKHIFENPTVDNEDEILELTLQEIFEGTSEFIGLNKVLELFFEHADFKIKKALMTSCCSFPVSQGKATFEFLTDLAKGKILTHAEQLRRFILANPKYKNDSIISDE